MGKKKSKKKKEKDHSESEEKEGEEQENDATKPLVPYEVADEGKSTPEESKSKTPDALDSSKFINSFGEVKFEEPKSKPMLPTLVFNEKTVELAPKDIASPPDSVPPKEEKSTPPQTSLPEVVMKPEEKTPLVKDCDKVDEIPSSKWDLDDTTEAYEEPDNPLVRSDVSPGFARDLDLLKAQLGGEQEFPSLSKQEGGGPENVLRRALANMEKDNVDKDKRRNSLEGSEVGENAEVPLKKKKRKSVSDEDTSGEEKVKSKKKSKNKKKKGLE